MLHCSVELLSFDKMEADILQGGFPCRRIIEYAGNKKEKFEDTRGTLSFNDFQKNIQLKVWNKLAKLSYMFFVAENVSSFI